MEKTLCPSSTIRHRKHTDKLIQGKRTNNVADKESKMLHTIYKKGVILMGVTDKKGSVKTMISKKKADRDTAVGGGQRGGRKDIPGISPNTDKQVKFLGTGNHFIPKRFPSSS